MDAVTALLIVLLVAASAACGALVWALRELVATARSVRTLSDEMSIRLVPLAEKADITIDAANAELLRIDAAITRFEDASVRVSAASGTLSEIVHAPASLVNEAADRIRHAWKHRRQSDGNISEGSSADASSAPSYRSDDARDEDTED